MRFHSFLIKYGEIGIKGKNRYLFEDALIKQIKNAHTSTMARMKKQPDRTRTVSFRST